LNRHDSEQDLPGLDEAGGYLQQWLGSASLPEANARRMLVEADAILKAAVSAGAEPNG
jgi:hypothetical protein